MPFDLSEAINKVLPSSPVPYQLSNIQCIPRDSNSPIHKQTANKPLISIKVEHLFILFHDRVPILALEVLVYLSVPKDGSKIERMIYISKADTTGLCPDSKIKTGLVIDCLLRWLLLYPIKSYLDDYKPRKTEIDTRSCITKKHKPFISRTHRALHILIERSKGDLNYGMPITNPVSEYKDAISKIPKDLISDTSRHITKLVLFARSEPQYLFPNSDKNPKKHVLSDSQLLKWWLRTLETCISNDVFETILQKKANILNSESSQIMKFFPNSTWMVGDVYSTNSNSKELAVYEIPLLPDDPKGRFLEHLVVENRIKKVGLKQFWTELSIRQEFRSGIVVGLVGVEGITRAQLDGNHLRTSAKMISRLQFKKCKKKMVGIDYSDPTESTKLYEDLENELQSTEQDGKLFDEFVVTESFKPTEISKINGSSTNTPAPINTINMLSVRSKKKQKI